MRRNWNKVGLFYVSTFLLSHGISLAYVLAGGSWGAPGSYAVANLLMLCPGAVAIGLQHLVYREPLIPSLALHFRPNRWFVMAWLGGPLLMLSALGLSLLLPRARYAADMGGLPIEMEAFRTQVKSLGMPPLLGMLVIALALGPTLNGIGGFGEEVGWRGFLFRELAPLGFWKCSTITGALWALWHVPLLLEGGYGDAAHPVASAIGTISFALLCAPLLHLVRERSGSAVACGILHGTMSSSRLLSVAFVRSAGAWAHAAIPAALLVINVVLMMTRTIELPHRVGRSGA